MNDPAAFSFRPALQDVAPYVPGRPIDDVRRETGVERIIKLGSNEGPYPPFTAALEAIASASREQRLYPDPGAWVLRNALSERLDVSPDHILIGNGLDSLIKLLCLATLDAGDGLAMCWPSFISWRQGTAIQGGRLQTAPLAESGSYDLDALAAVIDQTTKLVVIVSPNNPTGEAVDVASLADFLDRLPAHVLPVLDEAYYEYLPMDGHDGAALFRAGRRLVVMRTFSKAYGLAGLRVGYLIGPTDVVEALGRVRNAFDVNGLAQVAAAASLRESANELPGRMAEVTRERERVAAALTEMGHRPLPSSANFVMVRFPSPEHANAVNHALTTEGIIVRPAGPFGAPEGIRITIGRPEENTALIAAMPRALAAIPEAAS